MPTEPLLRRLPLVVGITGHRDMRPGDEPVLAQALAQFFDDLRRTYPATPLLLLTPLAEGADQLAAEVARRCSIPYRVPLPMPLAQYRDDFSSEYSRARFEMLLADADGPPYAMPFFETNDAQNLGEVTRRAHQYALLAAHLGRTSHVFIALWDGRASDTVGGTAQAVRFRVLGVPRRYRRISSLIDAPETGPAYQLHTPRRTDMDSERPAGCRTLRVRHESTQAEPAPVHSLHDIFAQIDERPADAPDPLATLYERIDTFNADCALVAGTVERSAQEPTTTSLMHAAERVATYYQHKFVVALQLLFGATGVALLVFELYAHVFTHAHPLVVIYLAATAFAMWTYVQARSGRWQDRAQDYRALEIGLNVQQAWDAAGVDESVADFYIRRQRSEFDWIRNAIRTVHVVGAQSHFDEAHAVETVRAFVLRQYAYFAGTTGELRAGGAEREQRKAALHEGLSTALLRISFAASALLIVYGLFAWLAPGVFEGALDGEILHGAIIFIVASTAIAAALFHDYPARRAHAQHARRYRAMAAIYRRALDALDEAEHQSPWRDPADGARPSRIETARTCILELGHEALSENGDWLLLHRELPIELLAVG